MFQNLCLSYHASIVVIQKVTHSDGSSDVFQTCEWTSHDEEWWAWRAIFYRLSGVRMWYISAVSRLFQMLTLIDLDKNNVWMVGVSEPCPLAMFVYRYSAQVCVCVTSPLRCFFKVISKSFLQPKWTQKSSLLSSKGRRQRRQKCWGGRKSLIA